MEMIRMTRDSDGIVTVWFDQPGKSVNSITGQFVTELTEVVDELERNTPRGVIFASAKDSFIVGGDLFEISAMDAERITRFLTQGQGLYSRIESLSCPTAAAINGDCLGGGFELALACKYRVAADDGSISIGLPEVKIGILPGWGGTVRLPRLIGLRKALPLLLAGKTMPPKKARKLGMIDETIRPDALLAAAKRMILSGMHRPKLGLIDRMIATRFLRHRVLASAKAKLMAMTHGNYPAPLKVLEITRANFDRGPAAGMEAERVSLRDLMDAESCHNLMRLFFLRHASKKAIGKQLRAKPLDVKYAAVIGGGTMGAGIVHGLVRAGIQVRLIEVNAKAASAALGRVRKMLDDDIAAGRLSALEGRHAFNRVSPTTEWTGLHLADVVIEAVAETIEIKREVFARLDRLTRPDAVLATNTSSLSVTAMAQSATRPNRVVGMHFFNPVPKMPLVEIVRTPHSDDASLATAAALAGRMGKTTVLVNDAPGFLVNRVLIPYLAEALVLAQEGASIPGVDDAMKRWGMPMGPFELLDEIGLDIAAHVLNSLGRHMDPPLMVPPAVEEALKHGWLGKKSGRGFYVYDGKRKTAKPMPNDELAQLLGGNRRSATTAEEIQWRLILPMINEAARLLDEGVTDSADMVDLATVLGLGFAPFRGGLARFADAVEIERVVEKLEEMSAKHGVRFAPSEPLVRLAREHGSMAAAARPRRNAEPAPTHRRIDVPAESAAAST